MEFGLSESQKLLKDNARKFFAGECSMTEVRRIMETDTAYDAGLWAKMAEQGYTGIIFPEQYGGVGLGKVEFILLMEEAGRALFAWAVVLDRRAGGNADRCRRHPGREEEISRPDLRWRGALDGRDPRGRRELEFG